MRLDRPSSGQARRAISQGDEGAATATTGYQTWQVSAPDSRNRSASQLIVRVVKIGLAAEGMLVEL